MAEPEQLDERHEDLQSMPPVAAADVLSHLESEERTEAFERLDEAAGIEVFNYLDAAYQQELLEELDQEQVLQLVESLSPDDRAHLLEEMPAPVARKLLLGLSPAERKKTARLLGFPEESAGRVMTPEYLSLRPEMTVAEALEKVRQEGRGVETIYVLPVVDGRQHLQGLVHLRDLVLARTDEKVEGLVDTSIPAVQAWDDREAAARLIQNTDALAAPVVDKSGRLLGLVTVDDAMDILDREGEENLARAGGGLEPLARPYFSVSVMRLAQTRVIWLLALAVAAVLTVKVLSVFEQTLESIVSLALFIPLLIGTGGNSGAQSATTMVRAMSVGEVLPKDVFRVAFREVAVGLLLGAMLGALAFLPVWLFVGQGIALVVSLAMVAICGLSSVVGAAVPLVASRVGIDPAVASAPFVTTLIDATGLLVYFGIANMILF